MLTGLIRTNRYIPTIQFIELAFVDGMQDAQKMNEYRAPNT